MTLVLSAIIEFNDSLSTICF
uniref:Uncharacterized protein n=1 Tax=Rhizophora mucronata TaxID=61149 RepID=A0A2P2N509_RHIMU